MNTISTPLIACLQTLVEQGSDLLAAQDKAVALFEAVIEQGLICPGETEQSVSDAIRELAQARFGVSKFWHKRIVRAGENTLQPYRENPPNRVITDNDIVFLDFGPVFENWEADYGRTYVLGDDPRMHQLKADVERAFIEAQAYYWQQPNMPASQLYRWVCQWAESNGWVYGGPYAGHLVGEFPHEKRLGDDWSLYIHPDNHLSMTTPDTLGNPRFWILEIHLVDPQRKIGAFHEALLITP